jgi:transcriptional regulator with XRE-family HTH domain
MQRGSTQARRVRSEGPSCAPRAAPDELRRRVGAYVRARREQLGLSQGDVIAKLGYVSRNSVSNVETGREGLPARRIFAWADVLQVPRDAFFRFVTGETKRMVTAARPPATAAPPAPRQVALSRAEGALLEAFRSLPPAYQRRLREQAMSYASTASSPAPTTSLTAPGATPRATRRKPTP